MIRSKSTRNSPLPSLNLLDLPKISSTTHKKVMQSRLSIENRFSSKRPSISISPIISPDMVKQTDKSKYIESPGFTTERNTSDIRFDISASYRQKNYDSSPFLIKSSRNASQELTQSRVLAQQESDTSIHIKKFIGVGKTSFNTYLELSVLNEKLLQQNEAFRKKIRILEERNKLLEGELAFSRNTSLIEKPKNIDFTDDARTDELKFRKKIEELKKKLAEMKTQMEDTDKENKELKQRIKSYTTMQSSQTDLGTPTSPTKKPKIMKSEDSAKNVTSDAAKTGSYHIFDSTLYDRLLILLQIFSKHQSLYHTLNAVVAATCKILNCGYARFLMISPDLKKVYNQSGNEKSRISRVLFSTTEVKIVEKKEDPIADENALNIVQSLSDLEKPFNNDGRGVSCPIFSNQYTDKFWGVIQISNPASAVHGSKSMRKKGFSRKDETLLDFYAKMIGFFLDIHYQDWLIKQRDNKFNIFNDSVTNMVRARNLQEFGEVIKTKLIKYFDFENIGILFTSPKDESVFTYDIQRRQNGQFVSIEPSKFSKKLGLSGVSITQNTDFVALYDPERLPEFIPKIDNVAGAAIVKNMTIALLKDENKRTVGVLHLINKHYSQVISQEDEESILCVLKLLGLIISNIKDITVAVNLTGKMERAMNDIEKTFHIKNDEVDYDDDDY